MAENIRGTIQAVGKPREYKKGENVIYYQSFKVNNTWYSNGTKIPPAAGTLIEFAAEKSGDYWNVTKAGISVVAAGAPINSVGTNAVASATSAIMSKDDYWRRKEERDLAKEKQFDVKDKTIQLQSCRNSAIEFVKLLVTVIPYGDKGEAGPALKLPANLAKREEVLAKAVEKYTLEFVEQNNSLSSEKNNNNEQLPEEQAPSKDSESVESDDAAWNV